MLFLSLIIIIRSPVMHFSQIWPPSTVLGAIFGSGYVLGHFGGQICRFWFWLHFSNFFQLFCNKIVKLGTFFNNLARNGQKMQKLAQNGQKWARTKAHFLKKHILRFGSSSQKLCTLGEWKWWNMIGGGIPWKNFHGAKIEIFGRSSLTAGWS